MFRHAQAPHADVCYRNGKKMGPRVDPQTPANTHNGGTQTGHPIRPSEVYYNIMQWLKSTPVMVKVAHCLVIGFRTIKAGSAVQWGIGDVTDAAMRFVRGAGGVSLNSIPSVTVEDMAVARDVAGQFIDDRART